MTGDTIERVITEAVTDDKPQRVLSSGSLLELFDDCLDRVLKQQLQREAEGMPWRGLRMQYTVAVRISRSASPIHTLYTHILKKFGPDNLAAHFRLYPNIITRRSRGEHDAVARSLVLFGEAFTQSGYSERQRLALLSYLQGECRPDDLRSLGLARNIQDSDDRLFVLGTLFLCVLGQKAKIGTNGEIGPDSRVYLLLSEAENLLAVSEETCWAFTHALEHLASDVGPGLTIWLNIQAPDQDTLQRVQNRLGTRFTQEWCTHIDLA
jgi:hypothetical protein